MRSHRPIHLLPALLVAALGLAACGGDDNPSSIGDTAGEVSGDTIARAAGSDDTSCPEQTITGTDIGYVANGLPRPITLSAPRDGWNCADWSGVSTPGRAFNGQEVLPGERLRFQLEQAGSVQSGRVRKFTLRIKGIGYEGVTQVVVEGETRVQMPGDLDTGEPNKETWRGSRACYFVPVMSAPSSWRDTPVDEVFEAFAGIDTYKSTMVIVDKGRIGLLFAEYSRQPQDRTRLCGVPKPSGA